MRKNLVGLVCLAIASLFCDRGVATQALISGVPNYDQDIFPIDSGYGAISGVGRSDCVPIACTELNGYYDANGWPRLIPYGGNSVVSSPVSNPARPYPGNAWGIDTVVRKYKTQFNYTPGSGVYFSSWSVFLGNPLGDGILAVVNYFEPGAAFTREDDDATSWSRIQGYINASRPCVLVVWPRFNVFPLYHNYSDSFEWEGSTVLNELGGGHGVCAVGWSDVGGRWVMCNMGWPTTTRGWLNYDSDDDWYISQITPGGYSSGEDDDAYEDNDTIGSAHTVFTGTVSNLRCLDTLIVNSDYRASYGDWFKVTASAGQALTVTTSFINANGDLDLRVYDPAQAEVGNSTGSGNSESVSVASTSAGYYYIFVYGYNNAKNANYSLAVSLGSSATIPTVQTLSAADVTATSARLRGQVTSTGGSATLERRLEWAKSPGTWGSGTLGVDYGVIYDASITGTDSEFSGVASGLQSGQNYKYRAWARNAINWSDANLVNVVTFTCSVPQYTISASAGSGGSISPSGSITKNAGDDQAFTASPNANYVVNQWSVDSGVVQTGGTSYTLPNIQAGHSVQVTFTYAPTQYTISASAGSGGTISPSGDFAKSAGSDQTFTAYPNASYAVNEWRVDGGLVQTGGTSHTLPNIQAGHSVQVTFTLGVSVTVQGSPSGVSFAVDGTTYTTAQTFGWVSGSSHPIATTSPQSGGTGVQYSWSNWSDGGAMSHAVAPTGGATFTANFTTQYRLDTGAAPAGGGTVVLSPAGTWFSPGQAVQLTALATSGYAFSSWAGVDSSSGGVASVTMNGYRSVTANFTAISPGYTFITLAGTASAGSQDGAGSAAGFNFETGAASDKGGNVYVADTYNSTIRRISPDGVVTTVAGLAGVPGSANGVGSAARFLWPNGVAVKEDGTVFVADTYNNTIRKITPARSVSTLAGAAGVAGFADGAGGAARFSQPGAVAVDNNGVIYVADGGNNSIRRITPGGVVTTVAGWTNAGYADGLGTNALLNGPLGVTVDGLGNVFVADTGNSTIRKIATNGVVSTLAGLAGTAGHDDGVGTNAQFNGPAGVAADAVGNVFVADTYNYTVRRVASDGTVTTIAGTPGQYGYQDGAGTNALFDLSSGVAVDGRGNVYVADTDNNVVRKGWWSGTPPEIVLHAPRVSGGQVYLDFTLTTGPGGGFTLQGADQAGGPWVPDATAVLTTNVAGVSYSFTTWPGALAQFYRIQSH